MLLQERIVTAFMNNPVQVVVVVVAAAAAAAVVVGCDCCGDQSEC